MTHRNDVHDIPIRDTVASLRDIEDVAFANRTIPQSTYALVERAEAFWPDSPAMTLISSAEDCLDSTTWTFSDLAHRIRSLMALLRGRGVSRDDAVALIAPNTGMLAAATLAAQTVGIAVPLNPAQSVDRITALLRRADAKIIIAAGPELAADTWDKTLSAAAACQISTVFALRPDDAHGSAPPLSGLRGVTVTYLDEALTTTVEADLDQPPTAEDIASFFQTGGTTGEPKLAAHTQLNETGMAWMLATVMPAKPTTMLAGLPLFHVNAVMVTLLTPLLLGTNVVWIGPWGYRRPHLYQNFWKLVEHYRINTMSAVPTVYAALADVPVDADISSLTHAIVGASPLPPTVGQRFTARTTIDLREGYGLTEATCASAATGYPHASRRGAVGLRLPYQEVSAGHVSPDGQLRRLPPGEPGQLIMRGPNIFPGYVGRRHGYRYLDTGAARLDGWLLTGDLGRVDADGFVYLEGRSKDVIIRGGHNIDPTVIEDAVLSHPGVSAAAAIGVPDVHAGEVPGVYVVTTAAVTTQELLDWCRNTIDEPAAVPREVFFIEAIPLTEVGKPYKPRLREDAAAHAMRNLLQAADFHPTDVAVTAAHQDGKLVVTIHADPDVTDFDRLEQIAGRLAIACQVRKAPGFSG
ncbi:acyl-CoA synthetase [soil metagenome]